MVHALDENIGSLSHRSLKFEELFHETTASLRKLLGVPPEFQIFFLASATEAWERIIENLVDAASFHLVNGAFSRKFYETAVKLGKRVSMHEVEDGKGFYMPGIEVSDEAEIICVVQNETSTGVAVPTHDLYYLKKNNPEKLLVVDMVSSAPYLDIDYEFVDAAFFSVQKGFGLPAGLGVLIVGPKAMARSKALESVRPRGTYHSFATLERYARKNQTPETPNVLGIYLLRHVLEDMVTKGIDTIRKETDEKYVLIRDAVINNPKYHLFTADEDMRSHTVIVLEVEGGSRPLIESLADANIVVGSGYGSHKLNHIRIANFPAHSLENMRSLITRL